MSDVKAPFSAELFESDLKIDSDNLNGAFVQQASLYAFYAVKYSNSLRQEAGLKMKLEFIEAKLDKAIREKAAASSTKITENQIRAEIILNSEYIKAQHAYSEAKGMTALAHAALEAFRQRKDMLVQLGVSAREEMKADPGIRNADGTRFMRRGDE